MAWRGPTTNKSNNPAPNKVSHGNEMSGENKTIPNSGHPYYATRATQVRRDTDKVEDLSITLMDIDTVILTHLDTVINPTVIDAGRKIKVPINYSSPERWKAIKKDGSIRDKNGKVQCPAIAFRRSTMNRDDTLVTFNRYLQYPVIKKFSEKNKYDRFSIMNGFSPVREAYSVAMPDHVIINYEFIIWTDTIEQGNSVVEAINFSTEDYWGDKRRYKFRTSISDYNFETAVDAGADRMARTTFTMMVHAYLLPDKYENYKSTVQKSFSLRKVVVGMETVIDGNFTPRATQSLELFSVSGNSPSTIETAINRNYPPFPSIAQSADHSFFSDYATLSGTSSYFSSSGSVQLGSLTITGGGASGSFVADGVSSLSGSAELDSVQYSAGSAVKWFVSINDGGNNYKTSEVVATWNTSSFDFDATDTSQIGVVPVTLSVNNTGGTINLYANIMSDAWNIKFIRTVI